MPTAYGFQDVLVKGFVGEVASRVRKCSVMPEMMVRATIMPSLPMQPRRGGAQPVTEERLGLPDNTPFPAVAKSRAWKCKRCGCTDIAASADWRTMVPVTKDEKVIDLQAIYRAKR